MMPPSKRSAGLAGVALALALGLVGCAGGATPASSGSGAAGGNTVTFRSWSPIEQTTKQMIAAYTAAHPESSIEATIFNYPEYLVDLQTRASSGTLPDIIGLQPGALTQQYREKLMPLQDCAKKQWGDGWKDKFYAGGLESARLGNPAGDENYYALPVLDLTLAMWANSDILKENNLTAPKTWDELVAASKTLKGKKYAGFMLPAKDAWVRLAVWLQIANNINPGLPYKAEAGEVKWDHPDLIKAYDYWQKLFKEEIVQPGALGLDAYPSAVNQFEAGKAAMIPLGTWWIQQSDPTKEGIPPLSVGMQGYEPFLFPTIPGGSAESQLVGGADVLLGIPKDSKNPELACSVVADWIAGAGAAKLVSTFNDLPAAKGVDPEKFTSDKQKEMWKLFTEEWMPNVKYSRYVADPKMEVAITDALASLGAGKITPEQAAAQIQTVQDSLK